MSKVAVTGSAGFIGAAVIRELETRGHQTVTVDRSTGVDILSGALIGALAGCDTVIHLAGILGTSELFDRADEAIKVNITGTLRVLEACDELHIGYVGITMPPVYPSIYTATKLAAQRLGSAFHHAYDIPVCHVNAFNAYGPGQANGPGHPRKIVPALACEGWANVPLTVWGDGTQTVDLIHTTELARVLAEATAIGDDAVIDAGTGHPVTVNEVAQRILELTGNTAGINYQPMRRGEIASHIAAEGLGWDRLTAPPRETWDLFDETVASYQPALV